ncbi:MAG TPA: aminopeptidase P family N-terminal domain-containing protein, partial [Rheinheimera sp.]|nr:aminopeptidase P family N-terminal domain-containing protein [Rheinheimera sp.]
MAAGIGGATKEQALATLNDMTINAVPIQLTEYQQRMAKAVKLMAEQQLDVMLLNAGTNLRYFTGVDWYASERLVCALLFADGSLVYVVPHFEIGTIEPLMLIKGELLSWHEHEDPYALCASRISAFAGSNAKLALDESAQFFIADALQLQLP